MTVRIRFVFYLLIQLQFLFANWFGIFAHGTKIRCVSKLSLIQRCYKRYRYRWKGMRFLRTALLTHRKCLAQNIGAVRNNVIWYLGNVNNQFILCSIVRYIHRYTKILSNDSECDYVVSSCVRCAVKETIRNDISYTWSTTGVPFPIIWDKQKWYGCSVYYDVIGVFLEFSLQDMFVVYISKVFFINL